MDMENNGIDIQYHIKKQCESMTGHLKDLKKWEQEMKQKEEDVMAIQQKNEVEEIPPKRSDIRDYQDYANNVDRIKSATDTANSEDNKDDDSNQDLTEDANEYKEQGNALFKEKKYDLAIDMYTKAIKLNDQEPIYFSNRAQCYLEQNKFVKAVQDATKAIELDDECTKAYYRRMHAYEKMGEELLAIKNCQKLLEIKPNDQKFMADYDRIHRKIIEKEKKKNRKKIKFSRLSKESEVTDFIQKPAHFRSKRPMIRIPIKEMTKPQSIPEAIIDKIFNNNTGENLETDSKLFKPSFLLKGKNDSKNTAIKTIKIDNEQNTLSKPKIDLPEKKNSFESSEINEPLMDDSSIEKMLDGALPSLEDLEKEGNLELAVPTSGPQFLAAWRELNPIQKFLYIKNLSTKNVNIGQLLGAALDTELVKELIEICHKYFINYNLPFINILRDLGQNEEMSILPMFLSDETRKQIRELLAESTSGGDSEVISELANIKTKFLINDV